MFATYLDESDLYLSAFIIVRCSLKVFALFLEQDLAHSTNSWWFEYSLLKRRTLGCYFGSGYFYLFSICLGCSCVSYCFWFCFNNLIWFLRSLISLSPLVDVWFVMKGILVGDFSRQCLDAVILLECLFCLVFLNDELLDRCYCCFPLRYLCKISWRIF